MLVLWLGLQLTINLTLEYFLYKRAPFLRGDQTPLSQGHLPLSNRITTSFLKQLLECTDVSVSKFILCYILTIKGAW